MEVIVFFFRFLLTEKHFKSAFASDLLGPSLTGAESGF